MTLNDDEFDEIGNKFDAHVASLMPTLAEMYLYESSAKARCGINSLYKFLLDEDGLPMTKDFWNEWVADDIEQASRYAYNNLKFSEERLTNEEAAFILKELTQGTIEEAQIYRSINKKLNLCRSPHTIRAHILMHVNDGERDRCAAAIDELISAAKLLG